MQINHHQVQTQKGRYTLLENGVSPDKAYDLLASDLTYTTASTNSFGIKIMRFLGCFPGIGAFIGLGRILVTGVKATFGTIKKCSSDVKKFYKTYHYEQFVRGLLELFTLGFARIPLELHSSPSSKVETYVKGTGFFNGKWILSKKDLAKKFAEKQDEIVKALDWLIKNKDQTVEVKDKGQGICSKKIFLWRIFCQERIHLLVKMKY